MRNVVLNVMSSASPRTSGPLVDDSSMLKYFSRWVCREKAPGLSGIAIIRKRSSGEMAFAFALRMPYLSQLRYLQCGKSAGSKAAQSHAPSMMALEVKIFSPSNPVRYKDLPHIMWFSCGGVALDDIL